MLAMLLKCLASDDAASSELYFLSSLSLSLSLFIYFISLRVNMFQTTRHLYPPTLPYTTLFSTVLCSMKKSPPHYYYNFPTCPSIWLYRQQSKGFKSPSMSLVPSNILACPDLKEIKKEKKRE